MSTRELAATVAAVEDISKIVDFSSWQEHGQSSGPILPE